MSKYYAKDENAILIEKLRTILSWTLKYLEHKALLAFKGTSKECRAILFKSSSVVIVRIWLPEIGGVSKLGHVSVEALQEYEHEKSNYISFWPESPAEARYASVKGIFHTLNEDLIAEQDNPKYIFYLFELDINKLNHKYNEFKSSNCNWSLLSSSYLGFIFNCLELLNWKFLIRQFPKQKQNCVGLSLLLLNVAGIDKINYMRAYLYSGSSIFLSILSASFIPRLLVSLLFTGTVNKAREIFKLRDFYR
jgi:hypothetical protein